MYAAGGLDKPFATPQTIAELQAMSAATGPPWQSTMTSRRTFRAASAQALIFGTQSSSVSAVSQVETKVGGRLSRAVTPLPPRVALRYRVTRR